MTRSVLERLRPATMQPDPAWAGRTLDAILRHPSERQLDSPAPGPTPLVVGGPRARPRAPRRRRVALVAASVVTLGTTGVGVHLGLAGRTTSVLADPAAPPPSDGAYPVLTDLGPLSADQLHKVEQACSMTADESFAVAKVHYARSTSNGSSEAPRQAVVVEDRRGEYRLCVSPLFERNVASTEQSAYGTGVLGPGGDLSPTRDRPLSLITTYQWHHQRRGDRFVDVHLAVAYAVTAQVDRVEVRLSGAGADGRWFTGTVHGGFVYIPLVVPELEARDGSPDVSVESRGYNASDQLVASDEQHYLNGNRDSHSDERSFWG